MGFDQLYPADHLPAGIRNVDKLYGEKIDFKDIKFLVKAGEIHKIEGKNSIGISVFGYEIRRNIQSMDQKKKCCKDKHVDLLSIEEGGKKHCFYQIF